MKCSFLSVNPRIDWCRTFQWLLSKDENWRYFELTAFLTATIIQFLTKQFRLFPCLLLLFEMQHVEMTDFSVSEHHCSTSMLSHHANSTIKIQAMTDVPNLMFQIWAVFGCLLWRWPQSGMVFDIKMNLNIYTVSPPSFLNDSLKIKKLPHRVALSFIHGKATWIVFFGFSFAASCLPSWIVRVSTWIMNYES